MGFRSRQATRTGPSQRLWPVFAILIAVVVLPTAGVLWFMTQAMQSEQQAVQQRLREIYRSRLRSSTRRIQAHWKAALALPAPERAPAAFALMVRQGRADSVLFYKSGRRVYPEPEAAPKMLQDFASSAWIEARRLELELNAPAEAARAYATIAGSAGTAESAMALMAQARCLNKAGAPAEAAGMLLARLGSDRHRGVTDPMGRQLQPNAVLFALQLTKDPKLPLFQKTAETLAARLNDYGAPAMSSNQRRFLMQQLQSLWPECPSFPTFAAEQLAAGFAHSSPDALKPGLLQSTPAKDIWAYATPDRSMIALLRTQTLLQSMRAVLAAQDSIPGVRFSVLLPGEQSSFLMAEDIGDPFPSWQLALNLDGADPFQSASSRKITLYIWTGLLIILGIVALSLMLAAFLRRQIRLTRLKNDLIATVTHELKTPLSSIRLLVDTLRDGHCQDTQLVQDYLQLIAKENARLSRLIEDFLTFSRMERNKAKFDQSLLQPREVIHAALDAVGDRVRAPGCSLRLDLADALPPVIGDRDALVTVLVNLLDNALKYSGDEKQIALRAFASNGRVFLEVADNGIGFPRSAAKRIFDRFYQVDQTLSRRAGGCGLGLSIVKFILAAHNGSITAQSHPGKGSIFTVQLPAVADNAHGQ